MAWTGFRLGVADPPYERRERRPAAPFGCMALASSGDTWCDQLQARATQRFYLPDSDVVVLMESDEGGIALLRALSISQAGGRIRVASAQRIQGRLRNAHGLSGALFFGIERAIGKAAPLERLLKNVPELDRRPETALLACPADIVGGQTARSNIWMAKMRRLSCSGAGSAPDRIPCRNA